MEPQHADSNGWPTFRQRLRETVSPVAWQTWLEPLTADQDGTTLRLQAPNDFHRSWVRDRYLTDIERVGAEVFGEGLSITISADDGAAPAASAMPDIAEAPSTGDGDRVGTQPGIHGNGDGRRSATKAPRRPSPVMDRDSRLIPKYTFDNFVVGQSNRFAHAAAMAVAEQPVVNYNPLFIYSPAGLGKTHLLHAVGHHRLELSPRSVVRYVSSEQFFNEFINGIRTKQMDQFKARYRTIDVLLLDDVQFFEGKEQILEEFFHTFNTLHAAGKQLVISSDRHPKHLSTLEDRLRSRFEWGLLTDIQPPDVETRLAILRKNAEFADREVPSEVLEFIATNVSDNIRELEGALTRVTAYAALTHEEITLELAQSVLRDIVANTDSRPLTVSEIIDVTASVLGISRTDLTGSTRKQPIARSRQIAMYLSRELTDLSLPRIGKEFNRDHTTVLHAVERVKQLMTTDKDLYDTVSELSHRLRRT